MFHFTKLDVSNKTVIGMEPVELQILSSTKNDGSNDMELTAVMSTDAASRQFTSEISYSQE